MSADSAVTDKQPVCLAIGGSDSCGGAGIQADLRVFHAMGTHGCSAITALTAQSPAQVSRIEPVSLAQLAAELHTLFDYYDIAAVKTGMLVDAEHVAVVSALIDELHQGALIVDPVMVASSGRELLDAGGIDAMVHSLLPKATLITPNLQEAAVLLGAAVGDAESAARTLAERFGTSVLLKGGHADGDTLIDLLCDVEGAVHRFEHGRRNWGQDAAHGTGCRLAAAITAALAGGETLAESVASATGFLLRN